MSTFDKSNKIDCIDCGHRATPKVDALGFWWCRACGFALTCDYCGQTIGQGHPADGTAHDTAVTS